MADSQRSAGGERDIEQAIAALKKGSQLLKYRRRGKPKFCHFHLSNDESLLIWYSGKKEKKVKLSKVTKIIPGQRTAKFQRYPRPGKEYQSFSLIYGFKSLDLICKDNDEAEVWLAGLKALISGGTNQRWKYDAKNGSVLSERPHSGTHRNSPSILPPLCVDIEESDIESISQNRWGKAFSNIISFTELSVITKPRSSVLPTYKKGPFDEVSHVRDIGHTKRFYTLNHHLKRSRKDKGKGCHWPGR